MLMRSPAAAESFGTAYLPYIGYRHGERSAPLRAGGGSEPPEPLARSYIDSSEPHSLIPPWALRAPETPPCPDRSGSSCPEEPQNRESAISSHSHITVTR
jgi:hypothetical protein